MQARSERGRGGKTVDPGKRDAIAQVIETSTLSALLFFSDHGRAYRLTAHDVPKDRLTAAPNLFQMGDGEQIVAVVDANIAEEHEHIVFVTQQGSVKRTELSEFVDAGSRRDGIVAMKIADDDRVVAVFPGWDEFETLVVTRDGQGIRFAEADVRPVSRSAGGIRAIRLRGDDRVVGGCAVAHEEAVVIATDAGFAKRLYVDELAVQARGGAGVRVMRLDRRRGSVVALAPVAARSVFVLEDAAVSVASTELKIAARDSVGSAVPGLPSGAVVSRVVPASAPSDERGYVAAPRPASLVCRLSRIRHKRQTKDAISQYRPSARALGNLRGVAAERVRGATRRIFGSLDTHNYRLYFGGSLVSHVGWWMQTMAEAWLVLTLTDNGAAVGATFAFRFLPVLLFGLWGGTIVDRFDRRKILLITESVAALLAVILWFIVLTDVVAGVDGVRSRGRARIRHRRRRACAARVRRGDGRPRATAQRGRAQQRRRQLGPHHRSGDRGTADRRAWA